MKSVRELRCEELLAAAALVDKTEYAVSEARKVVREKQAEHQRASEAYAQALKNLREVLPFSSWPGYEGD